MSYPQNDPADNTSGSTGSGYGQGSYGAGQGSYGAGQSPYGDGQSSYAGQSSYGAAGAYGTQTPAYSAQGAYGNAPAARPGPPSNVGWAVASILFFWPLSFIAMTRALDVYPLWAAGRHAEAEAASATAKKLGVISLALVVGIFLLYILFMIVVVGLASSGF